jgi:NlpC/P60 family
MRNGEHIDLSESSGIVAAALSFLGCRYQITRELSVGTIDCSTLVSQAYWIGGGIRIPFKAEAQRTEVTSQVIAESDLHPSDLVFAYRSADQSPGGTHNHVSMYMGVDATGRKKVIESQSPNGVRIADLADVPQEGGYRRFAPNLTERFAENTWRPFACKTFKLGRLGARLTALDINRHRRHLGTDVVLDGPTLISAPADGVITRIVQGRRPAGPVAVEIRTQTPWPSLHVMGPWEVFPGRIGTRVERGEPLGRSSSISVPGCNVTGRTKGRHVLHWELWGSERSLGFFGDSLDVKDRATGIGKSDSPMEAQNPIYLLKLGLIGPPVVTGFRSMDAS